MSLIVLTINVRGLQDHTKRRSIFNYYRNRAKILCLQETHSKSENELLWQNEWGGKIIYSHGQGNARGVCCLIARDFDWEIEKTAIDNEGRFVIISCRKQEYTTTVANIYAPNEDCPTFYIKLLKCLETFNENRIIIGDFNLVLNVQLDRLKGEHNNHKSAALLMEAAEELMLTDVWRDRNPEVKRYSWYKKGIQTASRIDFALVDKGLADRVKNCCYFTGLHTDHSAFLLVIDFNSMERGHRYWKLNVQHLKEKEFIEMINEDIDTNLKANSKLAHKKQWEIVKFSMANKAQEYARHKASDIKLIVAQLSEKLTEMEEKIETDMSKDTIDLIHKTKEDLEEIQLMNTKSIMFRSGVKTLCEFERNSKYFYALEKNRYNAKTMHCLIDEAGNEIREQDKILKKQSEFYSKLYTAEKDVKFNMMHQGHNMVSEEDKSVQNKPISAEEIRIALKQLPNEKVPGCDGLPVDFYKVFWKKLEDLYMNMLKEAYDEKSLTNTMLTGIINLIPKPKRDSRYLQHNRPITLLACDYKILEKVIANRMLISMNDIINQDQKGFLPERRIASNIRRVFDIMQLSSNKKMENLILSLDFMKCFDRISFSAITGAMKFFGFADMLIEWTNILYTDFKAMVQNNGHFSKKFSVERGVHQGGPASTGYFLICAEVLAIAIRENVEIEGIPVREFKQLLGQYADDADVFLKNDHKSINKVFEVLEKFKKNSGFTVNYDKTVIYRIGSLANTDFKCITNQNVAWTNEPINVLGIWIDHTDAKVLQLNYKPMVIKIEAIFNSWRKRNLSIIGKVNVINTLVASLFVYKMTVLPTIPQDIVNKVEQLMRNFIWNSRKPKVSLRTLQGPKEKGGLKLVSLKDRDAALKITWIQILRTDQKLAELAYTQLDTSLGEDVWRTNTSVRDIKKWIKPGFWQDIRCAWARFTFQNDGLTESMFIWHNSRMKIQNATIFWKSAYLNGLKYVDHFFADGKMKSIAVICQTYGLSMMQVNSLVSVIPKDWKEKCKVDPMEVEAHNTAYDKLIERKGLSRIAYSYFVLEYVAWEKKLSKWEKELNMSISHDAFTRCFRDIHYVTNIPKYRSFQYRLLQRAITTNIHLFHWKMRENKLCQQCEKCEETYTHMFLMCDKIKDFWIEVDCFMNEISAEPIHFGLDTVISNRIVINKPGHVKNFICLLAKQYIYRQRCFQMPVNFFEFKSNVLKIKAMEKYYATQKGKVNKHHIKWCERNLIEHENDIDNLVEHYINEES